MVSSSFLHKQCMLNNTRVSPQTQISERKADTTHVSFPSMSPPLDPTIKTGKNN